MLHTMIIAAQGNPQAAGLILRGIKAIFVGVGSIIAAIVCEVIAAVKRRNPLGLGSSQCARYPHIHPGKWCASDA